MPEAMMLVNQLDCDNDLLGFISGSLRKFAYNWATISIFSAIGATSLRNIKENYLIFGITSFSCVFAYKC